MTCVKIQKADTAIQSWFLEGSAMARNSRAAALNPHNWPERSGATSPAGCDSFLALASNQLQGFNP